MPKPLYAPRDNPLTLTAKFYPVMIRPKKRRMEDDKVAMSMGGPVAYCDTPEQAQELADILNKLFPPSPDEPE